jgi:hypothetical protein
MPGGPKEELLAQLRACRILSYSGSAATSSPGHPRAAHVTACEVVPAPPPGGHESVLALLPGVPFRVRLRAPYLR